MGAGASASLPDKMDMDTFQALAGDRFSKEIFDGYKDADGFISRERVLELNQATDCFLTHDWGTDELGRKNHTRVSRVNDSLKARGLITWFDSDRMTGNIVSQMCLGIDFTNCVIVFITRNYVEKVGGHNANDNCQLEFNYALRQKSALKMVVVVMEERMKNPSQWRGAVGMALGGLLYMDLVSDDEWETKMDALYDMITKVTPPLSSSAGVGKAIGTGDFSSSITATTTTPASPGGGGGGASSKGQAPSTGEDCTPLVDLGVDEISLLLESINLGKFKAALRDNEVDGATLAEIEEPKELTELGVSVAVKAKVLFKQIVEFKANGVPKNLLKSNAPAAGHAAAAPAVSPARASHGSAAGSAPLPSALTAPSAHSVTHVGARSADKFSSWICPVRILGATGGMAEVLNGVYIPTSERKNGFPVYRKQDDHDKWLLYWKESNSWDVKNTESKNNGTSYSYIKNSPATMPQLATGVWKHYNSKAWEDQPGICMVMELSPVQISNASGSDALVKMNGVYSPTSEMLGGMPVLRHEVHLEYFLAYNAKKFAWCVKVSAENKYNETSLAFVPSDPPKPIEEARESWQAFVSGSWTPQPSVKVALAHKPVYSWNFVGNNAKFVNSVFKVTTEVLHGSPVYENIHNSDKVLMYWPESKSWDFKIQKEKNSGNGYAFMKNHPRNLPSLCEGDAQMYSDSKWHHETHYGIMAFESLPAVVIRGAVGKNSEHVNGVFAPTSEILCGYCIYQKSDNTDKFLVRCDESKSWDIKIAKEKTAGNSYAYSKQDPGHLPQRCPGGWKMYDGTTWQDNSDLKIARSARVVRIEGATGSLAGRVNGIYFPTAEFVDDFQTYINQDYPESVLSYNKSAKQWQVKSYGTEYAWLGADPPCLPELAGAAPKGGGNGLWHVRETSGAGLVQQGNVVLTAESALWMAGEARCGACEGIMCRKPAHTWSNGWSCDWKKHTGPNKFNTTDPLYGCKNIKSCNFGVCQECWSKITEYK